MKVGAAPLTVGRHDGKVRSSPQSQEGITMTRVFAAVVLSSALALPVLAALKEGEKAPDFKAPASLAGKEFTFALRDALKKGPVVVYFYPAAFTGGCNAQAHAFSENSDKFAAAGASIIGVDGKISKSYDLQVRDAKPGAKNTRGDEIGHGFAERTTFIVTPDGKIAATISNMQATDNVNKALETVQHLKKG